MLNVFEKISILRYFNHDVPSLLEFIENLKPENVLAARKLIEDVILEKLSESKETYTTRGELQKSWEPIPKYFDAHKCNEEIDDCKNDTCLKRNPHCFTNKVKGQVNAMMDFYSGKQQSAAAEEN